MKKVYLAIGIGFLLLGLLMRQNALNQIIEFEQIQRELDSLSVNFLAEISNEIRRNLLVSRGLLGFGAFITIYAIYEELTKIKNKFI